MFEKELYSPRSDLRVEDVKFKPHAGRVSAQRLGNRGGVPLVGHEQHRDRYLPHLTPAGTLRLLR